MLTKEERKKRNDAKCRHFTGMQNEKCEAGLEYPRGERHKEDFSCFGERAFCATYETFTAEELAAHEAETQSGIQNYLKARKAITDKNGTTKPKKDIVGFMDCPCCPKGVLHYTISAYNGHIHARCDTGTCVEWME